MKWWLREHAWPLWAVWVACQWAAWAVAWVAARMSRARAGGALAGRRDGFYRSPAWLRLRFDALAANRSRNGGMTWCEVCKTEDANVYHVDHVIPRAVRPDLELDPGNLRVCCGDCNQGKGARYQGRDDRPVRRRRWA